MTSEEKIRFLRPGERLEDLGRGGFHIIQDPKAFCFGMDAVLLSFFAEAGTTDEGLDMGCGTGILPLLLLARYQCRSVTGLEIQEKMAEMAERSVCCNECQDSIRICQGDIREASQLFGKAVFDLVVSNPPYMKADHGLWNPDDSRAVSRHEILCTLEDVIREAALTVKPGGRFCMVHRPQRLAEIMELLRKYHLEPKRLRMVHPYVEREANMVLIEAVRRGKQGMIVEPPLIVFREKDIYTDEICKIYGFDPGGKR